MNTTTRPKAADSLKEWSERTGRTLEEARLAAGIARSTLTAWLRGEGGPRVGQAMKIEKLTGGMVPVKEWAERSGA